MRIAILAALAVSIAAPAAAQNADAAVRQIVTGEPYRRAAATIEAGHDEWVKNTIAITEIPAPPFKEEVRAKAFAEMLRQRGLEVEIDEEGNVLGLRKGTEEAPVVVVSAHLDTVFPEGTSVKVRREGDRLHAPGVGDDSAGLATMLSLIDAMNAAKIQTERDILFVGTVGEEGLGDLRGVKHLFNEGTYKGRVAAFYSIDGSGTESFISRATGSKRYRVTYKGPGGHSYSAFGIVNPMGALASTVTELYKVKVPAQPKTTYSASVVGGGTSVNSIPEEVWLEVDMRSEDAAELAKLEQQFLGIVDRSVAAENAARSTADGKISADKKMVGDRPAGRTDPQAGIVRFTEAAFRSEGIDIKQRAASTDANTAMSLGVPAITISGNAIGGRAHAPDEWIEVTKAPNVKLKRVLLASILATAGVE